MGKNEQPTFIGTIEHKQEPHAVVDPQVGNWRGCLIGSIALLAIIVFVGTKLFYEPPARHYRPEATPWPGWTIASVATISLIFVAVGVFLAYVAIKAVRLHFAAKEIEIVAADLQARTIPADGNGIFPWAISEDGRSMVNLNAAPAGRIDGLNGCPTMPDPETADQREATARASFAQLAAGLHSAGALVDAWMGRRPVVAGPEMPPLWMEDDRPGDVGRLLEAAEGEWRLIEAGDGEDPRQAA